MQKDNLEALRTFKLQSLPDLDVVTLGALELLDESPLPQVDFEKFKRPVALGSVNGFITSQILFEGTNALFADENSYAATLDNNPDIDGAFLLSASGSKHAIELAEALHKRGIETVLLTNNPDAPAKETVGEHNTHVFPKNREPYTYNTSTYMSIMLAKTGENPEAIWKFIEEEVVPVLPKNIAEYNAYVFIVPPQFEHIRPMLRTKYDELFGPYVVGRAFTTEEMKHAKTVVKSPKECFISFGEKNARFGEPQTRINVPLPPHADYVAMMAVSYYVVGQIQKGKPGYFKGRIAEYCREASDIFGKELTPIVE